MDDGEVEPFEWAEGISAETVGRGGAQKEGMAGDVAVDGFGGGVGFVGLAERSCVRRGVVGWHGDHFADDQ